MKSKLVVFVVVCVLLISCLVACGKDQEPKYDGSYEFVIYESDSNNADLTDNPVVSRYTVNYTNATYVLDTLVKKGSVYFITEDSNDYLIMKSSPYGLSYSEGYFQNYSGCSEGQIDVSWSYTAVNGQESYTGISSTKLEGLNEYAFVINGWKN